MQRQPRAVILILLALAAAFVATGCRRRRPVSVPRQPPAPIVQGEEGLASWYGHPYHGRRTASGEIYNMNEMTAAHRTLPFGTQVRVRNLENGRNVRVRINDRGPFVAGRIIDLSRAAAQSIRMPGTAWVRLEILGLASSPPPAPAAGRAKPPPTAARSAPASGGGAFGVQVGAFRDRRNAEALRDAIAPHFGPVVIQTFDRGDGIFYRVRVGREQTEEAAQDLGSQLREAGFTEEEFVVRLD